MTKTRTIFGFLSVLCLVIPAVFLLSACGETHEAGEEWSYDDTEHWHNCVVDECDEQFDVGTHVFGDWEVVTPAGCETAGVEQRTCVCGKTETRPISATGHTYTTGQWAEKTPATCEDPQIEFIKCDNCDAKITRIGDPALGHDWNDGVVTTEADCIHDGVRTFTCTRDGCGATKTETIKATGEHVWGEWVVDEEATCTEIGHKHQDCTTPGCDAVNNENINALSHLWNEGVVTTQPDCVHEGVKTFTCTRDGCGAIKTEPIDATGEHVYGEWIQDTPATCTTTGTQHRVCATEGCGHVENGTITELGHLWNEGVVTTEPTCTDKGVKTFTCTRSGCEEIKTEPIDVNPDNHNFVGHVCEYCGAYDDEVVATITVGEDTTIYTDLASAFAAATNGQTIVMQNDASLTAEIVLDYGDADFVTITLDLNGNAIVSTDSLFDIYNMKLILTNGTMTADKWGVWAQEKAVIEVQADASIVITEKADESRAAVVVISGATAEIYGKLSTVNGYTLSGRGNPGEGDVVINVYEGAVITSTNANAIYMPNTNTLTITGGTITGKSAVYIKSGTTTISGGTFTATGAKVDYQYYGNGGISTGDAIVIDACGYPGGNPTASITGGEFNVTDESAHGIAYYMYNGNGSVEDVEVAEGYTDIYYTEAVPASTENEETTAGGDATEEGGEAEAEVTE